MPISNSSRDVFVLALNTLSAAQIPFLVGGAFAVHNYTGSLRFTKDLDLFLKKGDVQTAMGALDKAGFVTRIEFEHWLGRAFRKDNLVDLIYGSGNYVMQVDESFFDRSVNGKVLDVPVRLLAPEEIIWSKSFVAARERFDGADIAHLINFSKGKLDWDHLLTRFGNHWQLLLADLLLFGFVYPSDRDYVPDWLIQELISRTRKALKQPQTKEKICRGTLLDRFSFVPDVEQEGYKDAREEYAEKLGYDTQQVVDDRVHARGDLLKGPKKAA